MWREDIQNITTPVETSGSWMVTNLRRYIRCFMRYTMSWKCSRPSMTVGGCTLYTLTCTGGGSAVVQGLVVLQGPGVVPVGRDHCDCCGVSRELPRCLKMDTPEEVYSFPIGNVGLRVYSVCLFPSLCFHWIHRICGERGKEAQEETFLVVHRLNHTLTLSCPTKASTSP